MIEKEEVLAEIEKMSRERFQRFCIDLFEAMDFDISSARSFGGDFEAEAERERDGRVEDYLLRFTRSGVDIEKTIEELKEILQAGMNGLFVTTQKTEHTAGDKIEIVGGDDIFELLKKFDMVPDTDGGEETSSLVSTSEVDKALKWGDEFFEKDDYEKALEYYEKALDINPESINAQAKKAEALINWGETHKAVDYLEGLTEGTMGNPRIWTLLGRAYHELDEFDEEIEAYETALEINEDHIEAWRNMGATLYENEEFDEAMVCFERIIEVEPEDVSAWNNKGLCQMKQGDLSSALNSINNAISIKNDYKDALLNKALVLEKQGRFSKAVQVSDKLTRYYPRDAKFHFIKAAYLEELGELKDSLEELNRTLDIDAGFGPAIDMKKEIEEKIGSVREEGVEEERAGAEAAVEREEKVREEREEVKEEREEDKREIEKEVVKKERAEEERKEERQPEEEKNKEEKEVKMEELQRLREERDGLEEKLKDREKELQELRSELEAVKTQREEKEPGEKTDLQEEIEAKEREIQELTEEKKKMQTKVENSEEIIDDMKETKKGLKEELEELKEEREEIEEEIKGKKDLKEKVREKEETIKDLQEEREELKEKIEILSEEREEKKEKGLSRGGVTLPERTTGREIEFMAKMGEYEKVIEGLPEDGRNDEDKNLLGFCYHKMGNDEKAQSFFSESEVLSARLNLEEMYYRQKRFREGEEISETFTEERPENHVLWIRRGEALRKNEMFDDATLSYLKAEELCECDLNDFLMAEARCNMGMNGPGKAIDTIEKVPEDKRSPEMVNLLGSFHYLEREYEEAIRIFRNISGVESSDISNNLACAAFRLGRYGEALSSFEKAVEMDGKNTLVLNNLGYCQIERNLLDSALANFEKTLAIDEKDPVSLYNKGLVMKRLGQDGWKEPIEKALELEPDFEEADKLYQT